MRCHTDLSGSIPDKSFLVYTNFMGQVRFNNFHDLTNETGFEIALLSKTDIQS